MRVQDKGGTWWTVVRRQAPWRRLVQPLAIAVFEYLRYQVSEPERKPSAWDRAKQRRAARRAHRQDKREQRKITGWQWLYMIPYLIVAVAVVAVVGTIIETGQAIVHIVIWLALLPFALVEVVVRAILGLGLTLLRLTGLVQSRVDVLACHGNGPRLASLTVLLVPGFGNAGRLERALAAQRSGARRPFDPADHEVVRILAEHRARVRQHASVIRPAAAPAGGASPAGPSPSSSTRHGA